MEFDSPDAKEFPGLYLADSGKADDSLDYVDDGDKKKSKKEKKKEKDKGYDKLAAESSQDEDDPLDPKSPAKGMKIKAFSKLSGKKKDKDKDKKLEKEQKKAEKEAKEKRKSEEKERKSMEKELQSTPGPASAPRPQIPFSGAHHMKMNSNNQSSLTPQSSLDMGTPVKRNILMSAGDSAGSKEATPVKPPKEKSAAFNVFLNAPAPLLSKLKDKDKDKHSKKEHKEKEKKHKDKDKDKGEGKSKKEKDRDSKEKEKKEPASGMAKVKLKLMRSKNSLEDTGDLPHVTSRQFPEDPEELAKEIKKYEGLLEQAHLQLKSSKKISKKQEEQLWELQRTLTQLKRKLRSLNALSSATAYHVHIHPLSASDRANSHAEQPASPRPIPIFKKCDSIDGSRISRATENASQNSQKSGDSNSTIEGSKENETTVPAATPIVIPPPPPVVHSAPQDIPKLPLPPSRNSVPKTDPNSATSPAPLSSPPQAQLSNESSVPVTVAVVPLTIASSADSAKTPWNNEALSPPPGSAGMSLPEQNYIMTSPRPSVDTIVQVHCSSVERSDTEEGQEEIDADVPVARDVEYHDEYLNRRSLSNESSHEGSKESIEQVLDDANKMIGSMHEELMFDGGMDLVSASDMRMRNGLLSDPARRILGQDDSDVELFTNDLELDPEHNLPNEEPCPDPFQMPVFDTVEYMSIENEALSMFNEQLNEDLKRDQMELEELIQKMTAKVHNETESSDVTEPQDEDEMNGLIKLWSQLRNENEVLWDNVNRLRLAVATCKVDEFRLNTRLKYIESKNMALSPVTTTTPLQTEA